LQVAFGAEHNSPTRWNALPPGQSSSNGVGKHMRFVRGPKDFWAGVLFVLIGAATVGIAFNYSMGTAARMGPGYFPRALGSLLMFLGALSILRSFRLQGAPIGDWRLRPIVVILGSVVLFGLMLPYAGLALSTIFLVIASSFASHEVRPLEACASSVMMAILCVGIFAYVLSIQVPVWPTFL
jgi:putative tricarboxylic transport membrane protein